VVELIKQVNFANVKIAKKVAQNSRSLFWLPVCLG
jgi:hypothetical protein